ncbi:MAG: aspartyl protease family protein [Alphaproteobacteria bacterium]|jgi:predicted aspartyl protease|uniref:Peptidase A2 domain-containing protein n=1 Tax=Brevundimonas mediterranea TaxID=74329 RepID=A0A7Z8Y0T0_9CAUL|nr:MULTISPECIES: aspartyl protease family protein [Brevundimonas]MBU4196285.1 aspartyl protease family protein [Alphaproteobacteria bacterium]MBU4238567.1 aspartyl protease family protein [Alphaproteobacteria bacterium]MCG2664541.1 aspartyl protease family protein [Brevundimonas sp.]VDC48717.1 hypothetical protein BREV_BREV_03253 [Brevundimonas mediterranea]
MHALILIASLALSTQAPAGEPQLPPAQAEAAPAVSRVAVLTRDTRGRPTLDAEINGKGPFRMVVDTAAQTSLVTLPLVDELKLLAIGEMNIGGVAGQQQAGLYGVDRFKTPLFDVESVGMLALPNAGVTEARGIIGMERFTGDRLLFDHAANRLSLERSGAAADGFVAVAGRLDDSGLLTVPVEIDGVTFTALVDTGAAVSVASGGALRALGWAETDPRLTPAGEIRGATQHGTVVLEGVVGRIRLGPVNFREAPLIFIAGEADDAGAEGGPSLILGADLLNNLDAYALDFPRSELQIRIPRQPNGPDPR